MMKDRACPRCGEPLVLESSWGGFVKRTPRECTRCGARLLYTTVGEVSVDDHGVGETEPAPLLAREKRDDEE